jgi:peptidyl-dipeptidase Dcp
MSSNPLIGDWTSPFEVPPFEQIRPEHFREAFDLALVRHLEDIEAIKATSGSATFDNTISALELSGDLLTRVARVFYNLTGSHTNPDIQAIEREMAPRMAKHRNTISLDAALFARVADLDDRRDALGLDAEQMRVLDRTYDGFVRAGAKLDDVAKARKREISERLAVLSTKFGQNVLADEQAWFMILDGEADLAGLPDYVRVAAARAANDLGQSGKHAVTLARSSVETFLQFSSRADLRAKAFEAWTKRGENGGDTDNRALAAEMVKLRAESARLMSFKTYAEFALDDSMAKTPANVRALLDDVWLAARSRAGEERDVLQKMATADGVSTPIHAADWRYWSEKARKAQYDLDDSEIKPYLQLDNIIAAAFDAAGRLFGVRFAERTDLPRYHPDVRAWEVTGEGGRHIGLFMGDYFARPSKRSGAWMSAFRGQRKLDGEVRPIIVNVMNFARGAHGEPTLLSFDDARTLFHEFGHALHGLLSDVTYPSIAGTSVARDFVELPSQLYEHWLETPEILKTYAVHHKTGQPMPDGLLARLKAARTFNQGFATVEYVSSALADLELHSLPSADNLDISAFEADILKRLQMPDAMVMRHRLPHFTHIFSGGYSSAYYSYMWSEVMDADAFAAFQETGNVFDPKTAHALREFIYSAGNRRDPAVAYTTFRGRLPTPDAMLKNRGLVAAA